jgi:lipase chaperone LimK
VGGKPPSLAGTRVDGGLVADAAGRFVPTPDARRLFDYFFAASGEEPDDVIVARIRAEIARRLSPGAAREATVLLERYVAYRARARGLAEQGLGEGSAAERLATLRELRRETLGADTAEALFAEEEEIDTATVAKLELEQAGPLTEAERTRRTAEIESALPVEERESRRAAMAALDLRAAEAELAAGGGSAGELQALRERMVGAEAAQRLAALDEQRRLWRQRVAGYRSARAAIEADPALDPRRRDEALARLRAERFTETERLRVDALDAVDGR